MQHISELASLLKQTGIRHMVLCPGSRNAPLLELFTSDTSFSCHSIVDERSAAYVALGMARQLAEPVGVVSTSGTAVLNLAPAVAEAHRQQIPLLVITADRPAETIGNFDNQRINQDNPFSGNCGGSMHLAAAFGSNKELEDAMEEVGIFLARLLDNPGAPLHLNLCLEEPLYGDLPPVLLGKELPAPLESEKVEAISPGAAERILILAGAGNPGEQVSGVLNELGKRLQLTVVAENLANLFHKDHVSNPELLLASCSEEQKAALLPDLIISFGGQLVSKRLKLLLQGNHGLKHVETGPDPALFLEELLAGSESIPEGKNRYLEQWKKAESRMRIAMEHKLASLPFGNIYSIYRALEKAGAGSVVHLGNSTTIRYSLLLLPRDDLAYFSNRGTSGIDGCVSTAVGAAMVSDKPHLLLVGDLSFVYDSNALWNKDFPPNLKIIVLNDGGGGIFSLLDGPSDKGFYEEFSRTRHPVSPALLAESFGRGSRQVKDAGKLEDALDELLGEGRGLQVLEVLTRDSENSRIFKALMDFNS